MMVNVYFNQDSGTVWITFPKTVAVAGVRFSPWQL